MRWVLTASTAWLVGISVYIVAAIWWSGYDGCSSLIFLPLSAAIVSGMTVGVSLATGIIFRPTWLGRAWRSQRVWATSMVLVSAGILCCGSAMGLTTTYTNPENGDPFEALHPIPALGGYFFLVFAITNWPRRR